MRLPACQAFYLLHNRMTFEINGMKVMWGVQIWKSNRSFDVFVFLAEEKQKAKTITSSLDLE